MRKRFLNLTLALGLVTGLFVGALGSASAATPVGSENEWLFFPWVPNGEILDGDGPWYGTVTVQNLESYRINIQFGDTGGATVGGLFTTLEPHASKTFSADQLGIATPGAGVVVKSSWYYDPNTDANTSVFPDFCEVAEGFQEEVEHSAANGLDPLTSLNVATVDSVVSEDGLITYVEGTDWQFRNGGIDWSPSGLEPPVGGSYLVNFSVFDCLRGPQIGGVEKQVMDTPSASAKTNADTIAVDGYTAIPDEDVAWGPASAFCHDIAAGDCNGLGAYMLGVPDAFSFDGHQYLPIVQTNNGWDSVLHITNVDASSPAAAAVTVTLYPAAGQGAAGPSDGEFTELVDPGETWTLDISAYGIPDEWVGSAWITSDYAVVTNVNRVKPSTEMAITNTAAPSYWALTSPDAGAVDCTWRNGGACELYAPLVYQKYNGWNTGISIVNVAESTNTVQVTYYGPSGNVVGGDSVRIPAKAMEYIYIPNTGDIGLDDFVGAAVLSSALPFHASIDEVKYETVEAMSYIATAAGASTIHDIFGGDPGTPEGAVSGLSLPLIQKGSATTGLGDTSGIQLFNPDPNFSVVADMYFFQPSGALAAPTLQQPYTLTLSAHQTATVYTMDLSEMSQGFQGSAWIVPVFGSTIPANIGFLVGVSNNVNYDVQGDGSAAFNALNQYGQFRFFSSQTPL